MDVPPVRHTNCLMQLPADVRNLIALRLGGRVFTLLGGCSYHLNNYMKGAIAIWKLFYLENNPHINSSENIEWREKYARQELIKRNIRVNNCKSYWLPVLADSAHTQISFNDRFYIATSRIVYSCDKYGEDVGTVDATLPLSARFKLQKDVLMINLGNQLLIEGKDFQAIIPDSSLIFAYGDNQLVYRKNNASVTSYLYDRKLNSIRDLTGLSNCHSFIGIHLNLIFAQMPELIVYDSAKKTIEEIKGHLFSYSHFFAYPHIIFKHDQFQRLLGFSCESRKHFEIEGFGDITHVGSHLFRYNERGIDQWSFVEAKFISFAQNPRAKRLIIDNSRLIGIWDLYVRIWNIQTKELIELKDYKDGFGSNIFVSDNILYCSALQKEYSSFLRFYDLSNGQLVGENRNIYRKQMYEADQGVLLSDIWKNHEELVYTIMDYTQPLPPKTLLAKIGETFSYYFKR